MISLHAVARKAARQLSQTTHQASSSRFNHTASRSSHISTLLLNPELTEEDASNELRWITQEVRDTSSKLMAKGKLPPVEDDRIQEMVERRSTGEPIQYILGSTDFGPLTIKCRRPVLIPRPETAYIFEKLSSAILSSIPPLTSSKRPTKPLDILDLCTGTGCISFLLSRLNPLSKVTGIDNSPAAIQLAMMNNQELGMTDKVTVKFGNLFKDPATLLPLDGSKVGLVVSNPPYIPYDQYQNLPSSVKHFESPSALIGDIDKQDGQVKGKGKGLEFYERISEILPDLLADQGQLEQVGWKGIPRTAFEIGIGQSEDVMDILKSSNVIGRTEVWKDQFGIDRMVVGWNH
ncbi:uncharacterized protein IL334_002664 [Kwoniella shivajii]|uniref:S-adenosylmethionine-dependent methyltransferase n=1 Tax=Kwoniella shivajii TaxID=564305 RepID=A0ABZ1CVQ8_9TREE|nr:hypothetical protein IL334_002664 [Kwoniella shivajii]